MDADAPAAAAGPFMLGWLVSLQASGRLRARLIADGALSFAFVPLFEMAALAAVYRLGPRRISFARMVDLFSSRTLSERNGYHCHRHPRDGRLSAERGARNRRQ
jgi:hypothetical protein